MNDALHQSGSILAAELGMLVRRPRHFVLAFVGFAVVTFVLVALLAVTAGLKRAAAKTGSPAIAIVMSKNAGDLIGSSLSAEAAGTVAGLPGVAAIGGKPAVAPEFFATVKIPRRSSGIDGSVLVRGVTPMGFALAPDVHLAAGRQFKSGTNEIIAGSAAAKAFRWLTPGSIQQFAHAHWKVTGTFRANGGYRDSEVWTDLATLQSALNAQGKISIVLARLTSPAAFDAFAKAVKSDKRLRAHAERQSRYYADQTEFLAYFVRFAIWAIAILLGAGAIVGVLNIMSTALLARVRELALYRALGFGRGAVTGALLAEVILIGLAGGIVGGIAAALVFNGYEAVTSTGMRQLAFTLAATPATIALGLAYAIGLGLLAGLVPAWQAGRRSVVAALHAA